MQIYANFYIYYYDDVVGIIDTMIANQEAVYYLCQLTVQR